MKPQVLAVFIGELHEDLRNLVPDTKDEDFVETTIQLSLVQLMRNTASAANSLVFLEAHKRNGN